VTPVCADASVSFLVAAWNAVDDIGPFVQSFHHLGLARAELVLCAGGQDGTLAEACRWQGPNVLVLEQHPGDGKQRALQTCWTVCRGDVIYLTDIDCRPTAAVINRLLAPVVAGEASATTGGQKPLLEDWHVPLVRCRAAADWLSEPRHPGPSLGLNGRNAAITRQALEAVGAFSTPAQSGTDYTLAQELRRRGHEILYIPGAPMPTRYAHGALAYARQQRRWLRNIFVLGWRYRVWPDVRHACLTLGLTYAGLAAVVVAVLAGRPLLGEAIVLAGFHVWVTRLGWQKRCNLALGLWSTVTCMAADALAVIIAGFDVLARIQTW
jgi:hypothetical protein